MSGAVDQLHGKLFFGDNLEVLRRDFPHESVDLIYLDPPFNSNASYNVLFRDESGNAAPSQIRAFDDTWHWGPDAVDALLDLNGTPAGNLLHSLAESIGENQLTAYLCMMGVRLVELQRVLKPSGNIYLHCDDNAAHYLRILMDVVFGPTQYRNDIIWRRAIAHSDARRFGRITDHILFYSKSDQRYWDGRAAATPRSDEELQSAYPSEDERGRYRNSDLTAQGVRQGESGQTWRDYEVTRRRRHWSPPRTGAYAEYIEREFIPGYRSIAGLHDRLDALEAAGLVRHAEQGAWPGLKRYAEADIGHLPQNLILQPTGFTNFNVGRGEHLGFPTQKPLALLEQLIPVACPPGGLVFDPFCGCGTTLEAAERLGRRWVGIDITHLAIGLVEERLLRAGAESHVIGAPQDLVSAQDLARRDPFQFEAWAVQRLRGFRANQRQWGDGGIDGRMRFRKTDRRRPDGLAVAQVKSGRVNPGDVQAFRGALDDANADLGVFITLDEVSAGVQAAARRAGRVAIGDRQYPIVQLWSLADHFAGCPPELPIPAAWERQRLL